MDRKIHTRREFLKAIGFGTAALTFQGCAEQLREISEYKQDRPNIIFILTDDQRWDAMSCMGHKFLKTPNMDRIAREGALFTNAFCTTSLCSPSRATFLTGTYAHVHGVINNNGREYDPDITPIYPELLQKAGYETAHVGKLHMAPHDNPRRGYDYWLSFAGQGVYFNPTLNENGRRFKQEGYITDILSDYAAKFIRQKRNEPFCLTLSHKAVHGPFKPPERHKDLYKDQVHDEPASFKDDFAGKAKWQRRFAVKDWRWRFRSSEFRTMKVPDSVPVEKGWTDKSHWWNEGNRAMDQYRCIKSIDEGIGKVFDALEETGQLDNTIIVFASDNGYFIGEHQRHDKRVVYDEAMRIAFLMMYPKAIKPNMTIDEPITNIDLAPTLLDYAGVPIPKTVQGLSLRPILEGKTKTLRNAIFHEYYVDLVHSIPRTLCVRTKEFKYISYPDLVDDIDELYDLTNDPYEMQNLSQVPKYKAKKEELEMELYKFLKETQYRTEVPDLTPGRKIKAAKGVMLSYSFGKVNNGLLLDLSGNSNNAKLNNINIIKDENKQAAEFTGTETIKVNSSKNLDPSKGPWVIEAMVKARNDGAILGHGDNKNGYALFVENGIPGVAIRNNQYWIISQTIVDGKEKCIDKWTHIVAVIKENEIRLYVNGQLEDWMPVPVPLEKLPNNPLIIGRDAKPPADKELTSKPFKGLVDSIKMYRKPFSDKEIYELYKNSK